MAERSKYQEKVIKNFYQNREAIALQRVQELVTDIFLAEGKKREQYWKQLRGHLEKLGLPATRIDYLFEQNDPALIAKVVEEFLGKSKS